MEPVIGLIQMNTILLKSTWSVLRYTSLKGGDFPESNLHKNWKDTLWQLRKCHFLNSLRSSRCCNVLSCNIVSTCCRLHKKPPFSKVKRWFFFYKKLGVTNTMLTLGAHLAHKGFFAFWRTGAITYWKTCFGTREQINYHIFTFQVGDLLTGRQ